MKVEINLDLLEEICCCIVDNNLYRDEACDYAKECVLEDIEEAEVING
jgi:hypothetical protein